MELYPAFVLRTTPCFAVVAVPASIGARVSEGIKRMLAEWKARERTLSNDPKIEAENDLVFARIKSATAHIDARHSGKGWLPSELVKIGYCVLRTGRNPEDADDFVETMLAASGMPTEGGDVKQAPFMGSPTGKAGDVQP